MSDGMHLLFSLLILLNVVFFFLGYIVGKLNNNTIYREEITTAKNSKKNKNIFSKNASISIDETKFVTTIKTDKLEKKFDNLGDKTIVKNDIADNINKLKQVKKQ